VFYSVTLAELARYGRLLDAADMGLMPLDARHYQKAAIQAKQLLGAHLQIPEIRLICRASPALLEILENLTGNTESSAENGSCFDCSPFRLQKA
jgi:hypothetical protein